MSKQNLLDKYKELLEKGYDSKSSFLNIFAEMEKYYFSLDYITEEKANEIIEFGDFLNEENSIKSFINEHSFKVFKKIYNQLKKAFRRDKDFNKECDDILDNLDVKQVRQLESLYKKIDSIKMDKEYKISYKDGLVYTSFFPVISSNEMSKILEFKSFLARGLEEGAVFICDFIDAKTDSIITAGFVIENGDWYSLRESFVKSIHTRTDCSYQNFIALRKDE